MQLFLIIVFALLLILGPVMMLRPSPRERRLAKIRQLAQQHRVSVKPVFLRNDPVFGAVLERNPHLQHTPFARYQLVAQDNQRGPSIKGKWIQRKTSAGNIVWESPDIRQQTCPAIDALLAQWVQAQSADFLALELGPRSAALVWNEKGDEMEAASICQQLEQLLRL